MPKQNSLASKSEEFKCNRCWHAQEDHVEWTGKCTRRIRLNGELNYCPCKEYLDERGAGATVEAFRG